MTGALFWTSNNVGDYRKSGIEITDDNGHTSLQLFYESHEIYRGKKSLPGLPATFGDDADSMSLDIVLKDSVTGLKAVLTYSIFEGLDTVIRSVKLINESDKNIFIDKVMSMTMDMELAEIPIIALKAARSTFAAIPIMLVLIMILFRSVISFISFK